MRNKIDVNGTDEAGRAREREQRRAGQVAESRKRKPPNCSRKPVERGFSCAPARAAPTPRSRDRAAPAPAQRLLQRRRRGAHDDSLDALSGSRSPGFGSRCRPFARTAA